MMQFHALDRFTIKGRGRVVTVLNPAEHDKDKPWPMMGDVLIDGVREHVVGVESFAVPFVRAGSVIGLLLRSTEGGGDEHG